jgi:nucleotide-binding universal stress UspA family protein
MKILIAVDGSTYSQAAVNEVARRPWPAGSSVKVISVMKLPFIPTAETRSLPESDYSRLERAMRERASAAVTDAVERLRASNADREAPLEITSEIIIGHPSEEILDQAEQWKADLIVVGSRGLGGFKRFLLGSVSQAVVQHAKCSVEIVRTGEESEKES